MNDFWKSIASIALGVGVSYGSAKLDNSQTSWAPYRTELLKNLAAVSLNTAATQYQKINTTEKAE